MGTSKAAGRRRAGVGAWRRRVAGVGARAHGGGGEQQRGVGGASAWGAAARGCWRAGVGAAAASSGEQRGVGGRASHGSRRRLGGGRVDRGAAECVVGTVRSTCGGAGVTGEGGGRPDRSWGVWACVWARACGYPPKVHKNPKEHKNRWNAGDLGWDHASYASVSSLARGSSAKSHQILPCRRRSRRERRHGCVEARAGRHGRKRGRRGGAGARFLEEERDDSRGGVAPGAKRVLAPSSDSYVNQIRNFQHQGSYRQHMKSLTASKRTSVRTRFPSRL